MKFCNYILSDKETSIKCDSKNLIPSMHYSLIYNNKSYRDSISCICSYSKIVFAGTCYKVGYYLNKMNNQNLQILKILEIVI